IIHWIIRRQWKLNRITNADKQKTKIMNLQNSPLGAGAIQPDFSKYPDGLVPAIIQDDVSNKVLMLGFMNEDALNKTNSEGKVTFYSRSKQRLWTKGETSNNFLSVKEII